MPHNYAASEHKYN